MANIVPSESVHLPVLPYTSYSHLSRFAQCPLSFQFHYVDRLPADPSVDSAFGQVLHAALEAIVRDHVRAGRAGPLDPELAASAYRQAWTQSELRDHALFGEGLAIVKRWIAREGVVHPECVLGVGLEFDLTIGGVRLRGKMDRVDRIGEDAIRVRDYRCTRLPPRRQDAEESLQLAICDLAARELFPWARRVELGLDLLRHDFVIAVQRTVADREATRRYILATAAQIQRGDFPARPSPLCATCDHRSQCPAWADACAGRRPHVEANLTDLPAVAREREELALQLKALGVRKDALDDVLRTALAHREDLVLDGTRYTLQTALYRDYPLGPTLDALAAAGVPPETLEAIGTVHGSALQSVLADARSSLTPETLRSLEATLAQHVRVSPVTRLVSRKVRREPNEQGGAR